MYGALAEIIIENEKNDYRFENFTRELCSKHEGIDFVPTSASWDRGRDARSTAEGKGSHRNIICASLNKDVNAKVEADLLRLTATSSPDRLVYCSSQKLSEDKVDEIHKQIKRHVSRGSVLVLGSIQLGSLAEKYSDIFERHYPAEIETIKSTILLSESGSENEKTRGLRLALIAFGSDEASRLRHEILRRSVLDFLYDEKVHALSEITETFSKDLGLPRPLRMDLLSKVVLELDRDQEIRREGNGWIITAYGQEQQKQTPVAAAVHLLEGRQIVRERLESLVGKKLSDSQYDQIWSGLIDFLSGLFYANGLAVIKAVDQFLSGKHDTSDEPNLRALLIDGIKRIVSVISFPDQRETIGTALHDLLTERLGPAFEWLTKVSERFVILSSLGLEATSGEQLREVVKSHQLVLDSDIIISYLCRGESDHGKAKDLLSWWLQFGGRILVSPVVLEEVAYHAWIAERDFRETEGLLGKLQKHELKRYIRSAFVRTYHVLEKTPNRWSMFIGQFRGNSSGDYSKIHSMLRQSLKVELLPENYDESLRNEITNYLGQVAHEVHREAEQLEDISYKSARDGRLMASIAAGRSAQEKMNAGAPIVLLSSSYQLRRVEKQFRDAFGEAQVLLSIGALTYLLSSIPDAGLGADSLRRALFEFGTSAQLKDPERRALRVIRASDVYDIPWAERRLLASNLISQIRSEAEKRGVSEEDLRSRLSSGDEPETSAKLITDSLRKMAISDKSTKELEEAKQTIDKLENRIVELESATRAARIPAALPDLNKEKTSRPKVKNPAKTSEQPFWTGLKTSAGATASHLENTGIDGTYAVAQRPANTSLAA